MCFRSFQTYRKITKLAQSICIYFYKDFLNICFWDRVSLEPKLVDAYGLWDVLSSLGFRNSGLWTWHILEGLLIFLFYHSAPRGLLHLIQDLKCFYALEVTSSDTSNWSLCFLYDRSTWKRSRRSCCTVGKKMSGQSLSLGDLNLSVVRT
jgi:hypothetical protein